jgi:hypothetical protein
MRTFLREETEHKALQIQAIGLSLYEPVEGTALRDYPFRIHAELFQRHERRTNRPRGYSHPMAVRTLERIDIARPTVYLQGTEFRKTLARQVFKE